MTNLSAKSRQLVNFLLCSLLICIAVLLIAHSAAVTESVSSAVYRCINVIIPSLFAFMALTDLFVKSGGYIYISYLLAPLSLLLGLPISCGAVFAVSNIGGYPVGASMISAMYDKDELDEASAKTLLCFCFNGGPAFFCGAVGLAVFGSARMGLLVYLSILIANMLLCAVVTRLPAFKIKAAPERIKPCFNGKMLGESVNRAALSLFRICVLIVAFSVASRFLNDLLAGFISDENVRRIAASFAEISNLSELSGAPYKLLPYAAAAGAFGGVCIMAQVRSIVGGRFSLLPFVILRSAAAVFSWLVCRELMVFFVPKELPASAPTEFIVNFNNFTPSLCLIMMIFLTIFQKRLAFSEEV